MTISVMTIVAITVIAQVVQALLSYRKWLRSFSITVLIMALYFQDTPSLFGLAAEPYTVLVIRRFWFVARP